MKAMDVLGCAGAAIAVFLIAFSIPFLGLLIGLLIPLPFLFFAFKSGRMQGILTVAVSLLIIGLAAGLLGRPAMIFLFVEFGLAGLILAEIFRRNFSFGRTMLWGTMILLGLELAALYLFSPADKTSIAGVILDMPRAQIEEWGRIVIQSEPDEEKVRLIRETTRIMIRILEQTYPALMALGTAAVVLINAMLGGMLLRRAGLKSPDFGALDRWSAPPNLVWLTIAAGFASFFGNGGIKFLAINLLLVIGGVYLWQGLMIVLFFFKQYRISAWIFAGLCLLLFSQSYLLLLPALAGLFDQWIDFRKFGRPAPGNDLE